MKNFETIKKIPNSNKQNKTNKVEMNHGTLDFKCFVNMEADRPTKCD